MKKKEPKRFSYLEHNNRKTKLIHVYINQNLKLKYISTLDRAPCDKKLNRV